MDCSIKSEYIYFHLWNSEALTDVVSVLMEEVGKPVTMKKIASEMPVPHSQGNITLNTIQI